MKPALNRTTTLTILIIGLSGLLSLMFLLSDLPKRNARQHEAAAKQSNPSSPATTTPKQLDEATKARVRDSFGKIPLSFEMNQGQVDEEVKFLSRGPGYNLFLTPTEAVLSLSKPVPDAEPKQQAGKNAAAQRTMDAVVRMSLAGANAQPQVAGIDELPGKVNYFKGNDPAQWRTNVPIYAKVKYDGVYPGVDLVYYGNQRQLEYDFTVAPNTDSQIIRLQFEGVERIDINDEGELVLRIAGGEMRQHKPVAYQEISGTRQEVACQYVLRGRNEIGFEIGAYDLNQELIIDPVITYSTCFGGSGVDLSDGLAVDNAGHVFITGRTASTDFPVLHPIQPEADPNNQDAFIVRFDTNVSGHGSLLYSTYLGGAGDDFAKAIKVDQAGNIYIAGYTDSPDFPTHNAYQTAINGVSDVFVTKLNPTGQMFLYSTYFGGSSLEEGFDLAVDNNNNAYLTGITKSDDLPLLNELQSILRGFRCGFVVRLDTSAAGDASLKYSTYLSGSGTEADESRSVYPFGVAADADGQVYVTGLTDRRDFWVKNAFQPSHSSEACGDCTDDAFLTRLNTNAAGDNSLIYSTYLGGDDSDFGSDIAVDAAGNAYITGNTKSNNLATRNAYQSTYQGNSEGVPPIGDVFVARFDTNTVGNASLLYSTYFGGSGSEGTHPSIAIDGVGSVYVTDQTGYAGDFPFRNALPPTHDNGVFAMRLDTNVAGDSSLIFSTLIPESVNSVSTGVGVDSQGNVYIVGDTFWDRFPFKRGYKPCTNVAADFGTDFYLTKIAPLAPALFISGKVVDGNTGLSGITVTLSSPDTSNTTTQTNQDGRYTFDGLAGGSAYTITPSSNSHVFDPPSQTIDNLDANTFLPDFTTTPPPQVCLQDDNGSSNRMSVNFMTGDYTFTSCAGFTSSGRGTVTVEGNQYRLQHMVAGERSVGAIYKPMERTGTASYFNLTNNSALGVIDDNAADSSCICPTFSISGRVVDENQQPLNGVTMTASRPGVADATTTTGADGNYTIGNLLAGGPYTVTPSFTQSCSAYNFSPSNRTVNNLSGNTTLPNFVGVRPPVTFTWTGGTLFDDSGTNDSYSWDTPGNWEPNCVPTEADVVVINYGSDSNYAIEVGTRTVGTLFFTRGTLGNGALTVKQNFTWFGGTFQSSLYDAGGNLIPFALNVNAGATMSVTGNGTKYLKSVAITNRGTVTWQGTTIGGEGVANTFDNYGTLRLLEERVADDVYVFSNFNGGTFRNHPGATIDKSNGSNLVHLYGSGDTVRFAGTVNVNRGTLDLGYDLKILHGARVTDASGPSDGGTVVNPNGGCFFCPTTELSGTLTVGNSATMRLNFGINTTSAAAITSEGTGRFVFEGTYVTGPLNLAGNVSFDGNACAANYQGCGAVSFFSGNDENGNLRPRVTISSTATIDWISGRIDLSNVQFNNGGTFNIKGGSLVLDTSRAVQDVFNNTGTLNVQIPQNCDPNVNPQDCGRASIGYPYTFRFNNSGLVHAQSGGLLLVGNGAHTGEFRADPGGNTYFGQSSFDPADPGHILNGANFTGAGGTYSIGAPLTGNFRGKLQLSSPTEGGGAFHGTLTLLDNATLVMQNSARCSFGGGQATTPCIINIPTTGKLQIDNAYLDSTTVNNDGQIEWSNNPIGSNGEATVINNRGRFVALTDGPIFYTNATTPTVFNNTGTFVKEAGDGVTTIDVYSTDFNNAATIRVKRGLMAFNGLLNLNDGSRIAGPGLVRADGTANLRGTTRLDGALDGSPNSVLEFFGNITGHPGARISGSNGGQLLWTGGTLLGELTLTNTARALIRQSDDPARQQPSVSLSGATLNNQGLINWEGAINIATGQSTFNNQIGATFNANSTGQFFQSFSDPSNHFVNAGTLNIGSPLGVLQTPSNGGASFTNMASGMINLDATSATSFDRITGFFNLSLDGTLNLNFINGYVPDSNASFAVIEHTGGTRTGQFARINATNANNLFFEAQYNPDNVTLRPAAPAPSTYSVSGQVRTETNAPIADVRISAIQTLPDGSQRTVSTTTKADGSYTLSLPSGGNFTLTATRSGSLFYPLGPNTFDNLSADQTLDFIGRSLRRRNAVMQTQRLRAAKSKSSQQVIQPGQVLISEFRLNGPGANSSVNERDEFIEVYNNTDAALDLSGYNLVTFDPDVEGGTDFYLPLPPGSVIPARGHFLVGDSTAYSLSDYAKLDLDTLAEADVDFFRSNQGVSLWNPDLTVNLDRVGFTGNNSGLYIEGNALAPLTPTPSVQYSYVRRTKIISGAGTGRPIDTNDNANDFMLVSATGAPFGNVASVLGAPGPENLSSPIQRNAQLRATLLDPAQSAGATANRYRYRCTDSDAPAPCDPNTSPLGYLSIRRTYTNNTGQPVTRLRFRVVDISTAPEGTGPSGNNIADLRVLSRSGTFSQPPLVGPAITVQGLMLEQPPNQPMGGGFNSSLSAPTVTLQTPLSATAPNNKITVEFLLGIVQGGNFRFFVNVEALP